MNQTIEAEVLALAEEHSGQQGLKLESRLDSLFSDSLEFLNFIIDLRKIGNLTDDVVTRAETLGDLVDGLVVSN